MTVSLGAGLEELRHRYAVERLLGKGGMGLVYLATERATGAQVALKVLRLDQVDDPESVARFEREAGMVQGLAHPHIVACREVVRCAGGLAMVMDYIRGGTLKERLRSRGPLEFTEARRIAQEVASALAYAHAQGILHRDVKPENIYLQPSPAGTVTALLGDFGIARADDAHTLTMAGMAIGTPAYMSPEQIDGESLDGRSDVYSLGMVLWEMLTGVQPWAGENLTSVIYKQKHEQVPGVGTRRAGVPADLVKVIEESLRKRPWQRFSDAGAVWVALGGVGAMPFGEWATSSAAGRDDDATIRFGATPARPTPQPPASGKSAADAESDGWFYIGLGLAAIGVVLIFSAGLSGGGAGARAPAARVSTPPPPAAVPAAALPAPRPAVQAPSPATRSNAISERDILQQVRGHEDAGEYVRAYQVASRLVEAGASTATLASVRERIRKACRAVQLIDELSGGSTACP